jgi:hypothetical protein
VGTRRSARLLRHGRGAARAVLSCAGAYVSGADGSNECPAGSARIETEAECRTAAAAAGTPFAAVQTESVFPRGCFYNIYGRARNAHFNTHAVGAGEPGHELLCAARATAGARVPNR